MNVWVQAGGWILAILLGLESALAAYLPPSAPRAALIGVAVVTFCLLLLMLADGMVDAKARHNTKEGAKN